MVNSNPETVSTDFDASSRLYFEPLDAESVLAVIEAESRPGEPMLPALVQFGGQTPLNLAEPLVAAGVTLPGLSLETIELAEERTRFAGLVERLGIPQPEGGIATSLEEALVVAERVGYPVIVRPSFVIGGLAIDFCFGPDDLARQLAAATVVSDDRPVRIDAYLEGLEVDVDAVCDGERVLIPGLMEHVERAGVHSGDSVGVFPPQRLTASDQESIVSAMTRVSLAMGVRGLINAQFIVRDDGVYLLRGQPAGQPDRAVPVQGHGRADGRARDARRARAPRWPASAGATACCRRRPWSRSRRRSSRRPSCAASTRRSARACSRPARSSACTATTTWRWPRR